MNGRCPFDQRIDEHERPNSPRPQRSRHRPGPPHRRGLPAVRGRLARRQGAGDRRLPGRGPRGGPPRARRPSSRRWSGSCARRTRRSRGRSPARSPRRRPSRRRTAHAPDPGPGEIAPSTRRPPWRRGDQATVDLGSADPARPDAIRTGPHPLLRRLRDHPRDRPRRHGRRLPGAAGQPQPARGAQDDPRRPARRRDRCQAVLHRGRGRRQPRSSGHRADLRGRPARGPALFQHGLRRGAEPLAAAGRRAAAAPRGGRADGRRSPRRSSTPTSAA